MSSNGRNVGMIVEIKGVVIDAVFTDELPEINHALEIAIPASSEREDPASTNRILGGLALAF